MKDDADGTPIPEAIQHLWDNQQHVKRMVSDLFEVAVELGCAKDSHDVQFAEVNLLDAIAQARLLKAQIERAIPYAVCPACQGVLRESCKLCKGRGAISKFLWESPAVSEHIKKMRAQVKK